MSNPTPPRGIGDNSRAALLADLEKLLDFTPPTYAELEEEIGGLVIRRDELLSGVDRCPEVIEDDDTEKRATDLARLIGAAVSNSETRRLARNEPARQTQALVNAVYGKITAPLTQAKNTVLARLTVYQRAKAAAERRRREEEARLAAEIAEAERRAAEAAEKAAQDERALNEAVAQDAAAAQAEADAAMAARAAAAKPAALHHSRGDLGGRSSLRTIWTGEVVDRDDLDLNVLRAHLSLDELNKAVRSFVRAGGRRLRGAKIYEDIRTIVK